MEPSEVPNGELRPVDDVEDAIDTAVLARDWSCLTGVEVVVSGRFRFLIFEL